MKWTTKMLTGAIIIALIAFKLVFPNPAYFYEIASDLALVLFLLGIGELLIIQCCMAAARLYMKYTRRHEEWAVNSPGHDGGYSSGMKSFYRMDAKR